VAGRPVAELGPVRRQTWVPAAQLADLWQLPPDPQLSDDLERFGGELRDPWS
jgi:antitoxin (DNA-binding transcriptional repressor) of toxin-antitoxin stability system